MSEITSHHLHNVYTPRGAQVRDALVWSNQINTAIELFGNRLEVEFASHHWPMWGREPIIAYLKKQRDIYKFIHDQTLRLANHGYNPDEIAEQIKLPENLAKEFYNRDYYGTVHHNARAVYVKYLGFFDGHPANLYPLPPVAAAQKYLDYMGGAEAIVAKAAEDYAAGEYRWVAEALKHLVLAEPNHISGRALLADTFEQLGYQSESAPWRNFFLSGALELRQGLPSGSAFAASASMAVAMPMENIFKTMAVRLNADKAANLMVNINLAFTDIEPWQLIIENSVLHAFRKPQHPAASASLTISSLNFKRLMLGLTDTSRLLEASELSFNGDLDALTKLSGLFDQFERRFPIVTARPPWD